MADELTRVLEVDLTQLDTALQKQDSNQKRIEVNVKGSEEHVKYVERLAEQTEQRIHRIEHRLKHIGAHEAGGLIVEGLGLEDTFIGGVADRTVAGGLMGGPVGAAFGALMATITEIRKDMRETKEKQAEEIRKLDEARHKIQEQEAALQVERERARQEMNSFSAKVWDKAQENAKEMVYQALQLQGQ